MSASTGDLVHTRPTTVARTLASSDFRCDAEIEFRCNPIAKGAIHDLKALDMCPVRPRLLGCQFRSCFGSRPRSRMEERRLGPPHVEEATASGSCEEQSDKTVDPVLPLERRSAFDVARQFMVKASVHSSPDRRRRKTAYRAFWLLFSGCPFAIKFGLGFGPGLRQIGALALRRSLRAVNRSCC